MAVTAHTPRRRWAPILALVAALLGAVLLAAPASAVTTEAVRDLDLCTQHTIAANDDGSSDEVELPFPMDFAGEQRTSLFVNNNGNVTFDSPLSQYTPQDLTGATGNAMIAPFFADVDTRGPDSALVTYGASETQLCVNWVDVGYYSAHDDKRISAQLVITDHSALTGSSGDVGLELNYSDIGWETGDASGGSDGLGGTPVAVGYTAGTGEPGTYQQFTGSLVSGALVDGGPNALVASSRNSTVLGRYIFHLGGEEPVTQGSVVGTVTDEDDEPVVAEVIVCRAGSDTECVTTLTTASGTYSVVGLPVGEHEVHALPYTAPDLAAATRPVTITAGQESVVDFALPAVARGDLEITVLDWDGAPVTGAEVEACEVATGGCLAALTDAAGSVAVTEVAAGDYEVEVTAPAGSRLQDAGAALTVPAEETGELVVTLLPVADRELTGVVEDQHGEPVAGATVTLALDREGERTVLPEGSALLAGETPQNPQTTGADGTVGWGLVEATYEVSATAESCAEVTTRVEGFDEDGSAHVVLAVECAEPPPTEEPTTEAPTTEDPEGEDPTSEAPTQEATTADPTTSSPSPSATPGEGMAGTGVAATALGGLALTFVAAGALLVARRRRLGREPLS